MKHVAIVTDSNSGITQEQAKKDGIAVLPMPFYLDNELYYEDITLTQEAFYEKLAQGVDIRTAAPFPGEVMELWDKILTDHDELVYIPMTSSMSSSFATALMLSKEYDGRVQVVDNQRISVTLRRAVLDACAMADAGCSAVDIRQYLEDDRHSNSIYITLDTLKYLKRGGRVTPTAAAIGEVLNLKPVLQIQGGKLDAYTNKCRGKKMACQAMIRAMKDDFQNRFAVELAAGQMELEVAYAGNPDEALLWKAQVEEAFPGFAVHMDALSLSISCHIGPGALAIACAKIRQN